MPTPIDVSDKNSKASGARSKETNKSDRINETKRREDSKQNNQTKMCKSVALNVDPFQSKRQTPIPRKKL